nr:unnamed protein product [Callosobruchus analis]
MLPAIVPLANQRQQSTAPPTTSAVPSLARQPRMATATVTRLPAQNHSSYIHRSATDLWNRRMLLKMDCT